MRLLLFVLLVATPAAFATAITIAPGVEMPMVNLGGVSSRPSNYTSWLQMGGVGLDTALSYGDPTQKEVASAITLSGLQRDKIFLTTKVPCCPMSIKGYCENPELNATIEEVIAKDVALLGRIDLLLLHWPCDTLEDTQTAYAGLEAALEQGITRAIGVSNFNASLLAAMLPTVKAKPSVNQCGHSIGAHNATHNPAIGGDDETVKFCQKNGIVYEAYSPLGGLSGLDIYRNPTVVAIGKKHGVSPAQVALRWLVQQKIAVVTAAENAEYQAEDMDVFSFELTDDEMQTLAEL